MPSSLSQSVSVSTPKTPLLASPKSSQLAIKTHFTQSISPPHHPESKSLWPDGKPCQPDTRGLLQRAHITAGEIRYIDEESSSMWSQGDDLSVALDLEETGFRVVEYGRRRRVLASDEIRKWKKQIGIKQCARESNVNRYTIRAWLRGKPIPIAKAKKILEVVEKYKNCEESLQADFFT